jgi:uncharacterized protein (TIGR03437 family)
VTVRSGNGNIGGRDSAVKFFLGPSAGDFSLPLTSADFSNAQAGPAAFIVSPNPLWISGLSEDPSAKWVGTNANSETSGNTALYAISFQIASAFSSATLTLHYASDDTPSFTEGVILNGTTICEDQIALGFTQEHTLVCNDVGPLLQVGTNWLYFDIVNAQAGTGAGLLFSATITQTESPVPSIDSGRVVNAASYTAPVVPGSIVAAFGNFLLSSPSEAPGKPLPTYLAGLSMIFGSGLDAPLFYVSGRQVNLQVPWELAGQMQSPLTASIGGQTSAAQTVNLAPFAPGIFSMNGQGTGQGAIQDSQYRLVDFSNPVSVGDAIQIYCTGLGAVTNQPASGFPAPFSPLLAETTTAPVVAIGGTSAHVLYSGLTPSTVGLYQVNAQVPAGIATGPSVPVMISIGGVASNTVTIAVGPLATNPEPSITSLSPPSAPAGSGPVTLTIIGSGLIASSSVTFNGVLHTASFVGASQLTTTLGAADLAMAGSFPVVVTNPPPGGGASSAVNFTATAIPQITNFPVGTHPVALAFDGTNIWVANNGSGSVTKLRASDGTILGTFSAGVSPNALVFDGSHIWVANSGTGFVTELRASDGAILGTFLAVVTSAAALAFDGSSVWVTDAGPGLVTSFVTKLRASNGTLLGTFPVGVKPFGEVFDGVSIWVANTWSNTVTKLRASDGANMGTFAAGGFPNALAFDRHNIWAADLSGTVTELQASNGATLGSFLVGNNPEGVAFDGLNIWVANSGSNNVTKLRASDGTVLGTFAVQSEPSAVVFDGTSIWVANYGSNSVSKIPGN